jgi:hypothetical protein
VKRSAPLVVTGAVEGLVDEAVFRRLVTYAGAVPGPVNGKKGKAHLLSSLKGYNAAAQFSPWFVLMDLDNDDDCAPPFRSRSLPKTARQMCFRIAVREVEAWLLADATRISTFLGVNASRLPSNPDSERDPKRLVVSLASHSRIRDIKNDLVPRPEARRVEGPAYTARLVGFVLDTRRGWRPAVAAKNSDSLARCIRCLKAIVKAHREGGTSRARLGGKRK